MDASAPWWGAALISFVPVLLTLIVTGRQTARSRWATDKRSIYANLIVAGKTLRDIPVWPADRSASPADTAPLVANISDLAENAGLLAARSVARRVYDIVGSAEEFAATIERIRRDSQPGHRGAVDERQRPAYDTARASFVDGIHELTNAARSDIRAGRGLGRDWFARRPTDPA